MGKAHPSSHGRSYIPNTMFLWLIIQLLMTIKTAHKLLSLTHRNCKGKPNIWILPPLLQKNKYGRSQLYRDQIFSHTIYLYNREFVWCLIVGPIWLVWHTYIADLPVHNIYITRRLRGIFLQKNNSINYTGGGITGQKSAYPNYVSSSKGWKNSGYLTTFFWDIND